MRDLPPVEATQWDSLLDEAIFEARGCLRSVLPSEDADDLRAQAAEWIALADTILERQRNELAFERWRDAHAGE